MRLIKSLLTAATLFAAPALASAATTFTFSGLPATVLPGATGTFTIVVDSTETVVDYLRVELMVAGDPGFTITGTSAPTTPVLGVFSGSGVVNDINTFDGGSVKYSVYKEVGTSDLTVNTEVINVSYEIAADAADGAQFTLSFEPYDGIEGGTWLLYSSEGELVSSYDEATVVVAIPEPAALVLLLIGGIALMVPERRASARF